MINEKIIPKDVYSTNEIKTNKVWIDNRPIYRKVLTANSVSTGGEKTIQTGTTNVKEYVRLEGYAYSSGGAVQPIPKAHNNSISFQMGIYIATNNTVRIEAGSSISGINKVYVILEYTKTTD